MCHILVISFVCVYPFSSYTLLAELSFESLQLVSYKQTLNTTYASRGAGNILVADLAH